jgi:hypothetical protein
MVKGEHMKTSTEVKHTSLINKFAAIYTRAVAQNPSGTIYENIEKAFKGFPEVLRAVNRVEQYEKTLRLIAERDKGQAGIEAREALAQAEAQ